MKKGLFISFEGIDSSGKKTQALLLYNRLKSLGLKTKYADFPAYNTPFGNLVARFLKGEFGEINEVPQEIIPLFYAIDRYQFKDEFQSFLDEGGILISNRYTQSNLAFQTAELSERERFEFIEWMCSVESRIPQPDFIFLIDMPAYVARTLMRQKSLRAYLNGKEKDIYEEKMDFQEKVRKAYLDISSRFKNWIVISAVKDKRLKSVSEIHELIWKHYQRIKGV